MGADGSKRMIIASWAAAGVVAVLAIMDLVMGIPFGSEMTTLMDILFIVAAALVGYLGWDAYRDLR